MRLSNFTISALVVLSGYAAITAPAPADAAQPTQLCAPSDPGTPLVCRVDPSATVIHVYGAFTACKSADVKNCDAGTSLAPVAGRKAKLELTIDCLNYDQVITVTGSAGKKVVGEPGKQGVGNYDHSFPGLKHRLDRALKGGDSCSTIVKVVKQPLQAYVLNSVGYGTYYK